MKVRTENYNSWENKSTNNCLTSWIFVCICE